MDYYNKAYEMCALLENYGGKTACLLSPFSKYMDKPFFYERSDFLAIEFILPAKENPYRIIIDKNTNKTTLLELHQDYAQIWIEDTEDTEDLELTLDKINGLGVHL